MGKDNTKNRYYKEYRRIYKEYCEYRPRTGRWFLADWQESELYDQLYQAKFRRFQWCNRTRNSMKEYVRIHNKKDRAFNNQVLHRVMKIEEYDGYEFNYNHRHSALWEW